MNWPALLATVGALLVALGTLVGLLGLWQLWIDVGLADSTGTSPPRWIGQQLRSRWPRRWRQA